MIKEFNFDGLVGPTHNFAGLAFGNIASNKYSNQTAFPKKAALQGLEKMVMLMRLGISQGVLPPQERPHIPTLRRLGFTAPPEECIASLAQNNPALLLQLSSASCMWVANACTTSPSCDTTDGKTHFTPANLSSMLHRSIEHEQTQRALQRIFSNSQFFKHHPTLPGTAFFGDEGAANHTRFCDSQGKNGLALFVYGQSFLKNQIKPQLFPARQTLEASEAVARQHGLNPKHTIFLQQNPKVIDQGVFHNDVIAVGSQSILLCHEQAFLDQKRALKKLKTIQEKRTQTEFHIIEATTKAISIDAAVSSYLFNTQLVFPTPDKAIVIAPQECAENQAVFNFLEKIVSQDNPIASVEYFDLRQSMKNGGGPACLRLRVTLNQSEINSLTTNTLMTEQLYETLKQWVNLHYRDELEPSDLIDPTLYQECLQALDELTGILNLGSDFYDFQVDINKPHHLGA